MAFLIVFRYLEADNVLKRIARLENDLIAKLEVRREEIAERHIETFAQKQRHEMEILKRKVDSKRAEIQKQKKIEFDR